MNAALAATAATTLLFPVDDPSGVGAARRGIAALARAAGLSEAASGRAAIVATELATNLQLHAQGGRMLARAQRAANDGGAAMLELLAVDSGPGMPNPDQCLRDGYSTAGTAGNGLGAVRRLARVFDLASQPGAGTIVLARIGEEADAPVSRAVAGGLRFGAVSLPKDGEEVCGDTWAWHADARGASLMVFDGLGHGVAAAEAAAVAHATFSDDPRRAPEEQLARLHERLQGTRGGAAAIARVDTTQGTLRYAGVGNIAGMLAGAERRRGLPSHNGILGSVLGRVQGFDYPWQRGDLLVMHSDGVKSRWDLDGIRGAAERDPAVLAALVYRDFARGRDDVTVAVVKG